MAWMILASPFFCGLLAGGEVLVRFGVRGPLARLDRHAHIAMRQGLIRSLRVLVPILFALALLSSIGVAVARPTPFGFASIALLVAFIALTLAGTVPINQAVSGWDPAAPPPDWQDAIRRWERLDDWRTLLAICAFATALLSDVVYLDVAF